MSVLRRIGWFGRWVSGQIPRRISCWVDKHRRAVHPARQNLGVKPTQRRSRDGQLRALPTAPMVNAAERLLPWLLL